MFVFLYLHYFYLIFIPICPGFQLTNIYFTKLFRSYIAIVNVYYNFLCLQLNSVTSYLLEVIALETKLFQGNQKIYICIKTISTVN